MGSFNYVSLKLSLYWTSVTLHMKDCWNRETQLLLKNPRIQRRLAQKSSKHQCMSAYQGNLRASFHRTCLAQVQQTLSNRIIISEKVGLTAGSGSQHSSINLQKASFRNFLFIMESECFGNICLATFKNKYIYENSMKIFFPCKKSVVCQFILKDPCITSIFQRKQIVKQLFRFIFTCCIG